MPYRCRHPGDPENEFDEVAASSPGLAAERFAADMDAAAGEMTEFRQVAVSSDRGATWTPYRVSAWVERRAVREG